MDDLRPRDGKQKPARLRGVVPGYSEQRRELDMLNQLEQLRGTAAADTQVEAVMKSMEVAYRMQTDAPEVFDIRKESQPTLDLYGEGFVARGCLMAVRLAEKGVRMTQ